MDIKDRVVLISGASRGLGAEIARAFAAEGARLVLTARSLENLERLRQEVDPTAVLVAGDIRDPALDERLLTALDAMGGVDILVNNAGVEDFGGFLGHPWKDVEALLSVNLLAPMRLVQALLPGMLARQRGAIVNVASLAGLTGLAWGEGYCASKHGLVGFTRALRASLAEHGTPVSASVVCPGFISEVGMYIEMQRVSGARAPASLGSSSPRAVASAVLTAVRRQQACVIVNPVPIAPLIALSAFVPRAVEKVTRALGVGDFFSALAERRYGASGRPAHDPSARSSSSALRAGASAPPNGAD
jgi:short-subunit dehydrogenase